MATIGVRLKELRKSLKLNQETMAKGLGINRVTYAYWETDKANCPDRSIKQICATYSVNYEWLANGTGEMFSKRSIVDDVMQKYPQFGDLERCILSNWLKIPHAERERLLQTISDLFNIKKDG